MMLLIHNVWLPFDTMQHGWLLTEGSRIAGVGTGELPSAESAQRIDGQGGWLLPGFIDVHVHGSAGADTMDATPDALRTMARFFATRGVTGFLATTMTHSRAAITTALENIAACMGAPTGGAALLGAHLEGPYINLKLKGAQDGRYVRTADPAEYAHWLDLNVIRQVTVAPEFPENVAFMRECVKRDIVVSLGHTQATYEQVIEAVNVGARQATHTFNAMTGLHHRQPGTVGGVLASDAITCEVIADLIHVHPAVVKIIVQAKGLDRVVIITDAIRAAGMGDGTSELGGQPVTVRDGKATLADGTLAGSLLTLDQGLRNVIGATQPGLIAPMAASIFSANAARQLGLAQRKGRIAQDFDADLVVLDAQHHVRLTIVAGDVVYAQAPAIGA
jgi:N-acetylglucosamine-6-phosphate deacetylase